MKNSIRIQIETHVYAEERLRDEILNASLGEDVDSCGIIPPETVFPLRKNRSPNIQFDYDTDTTLGDVKNAVLDVFGFLDKDELLHPKIAFICSDRIRYWINNENANFETVINRYLDPDNNGIIYVAAYVCCDAGTICRDDGIRYYMNSHENGKHHEPHVHLEAIGSGEDAVVIIKTLEIKGEFPRNLAKKAKKRIKEETRFFLEQWNALTDGIEVDVNRYMGLIDY